MIGKYRLLKKKTFESLEKFEARLNQECSNGWRVVSLASDSSYGLVALLERENKH
jgi:hypothetical protein